MNAIIRSLQAKGLITDVLGALPKGDLKPALAVWARSEPKASFVAFISLARALSRHPLQVYVDDVWTMLATRRSREEQSAMNERYQRFFSEHGAQTHFVSDRYRARFHSREFEAIIDIANALPLSEFVRCLPLEKRAAIGEITGAEMLHALCELLVLEEIKRECNVLLVGHFSQSIVVCHRRVSKDPLPSIALPRVEPDCLGDYRAALLVPSG